LSNIGLQHYHNHTNQDTAKFCSIHYTDQQKVKDYDGITYFFHIRIFLAMDDWLLALLNLFLCVVPFGCSAAGTVKGWATGAQTWESLGQTISAIYHHKLVHRAYFM
jgi:hypothetical protein